VREVERYAAAKLRRAGRAGKDSGEIEGRIGATYLNKTLATLRAILKDAVRYGLIVRNPAEDVRVATVRFNGSYLDMAAQITALLDGAGELDRERGRRTVPYRRALLATLTFSGLRIDEALGLRWSQVDLAAGKLRVAGTKTAAARRTIDMLPALRDELMALKLARDPGRDELVFGTSRGGKDSPSNVRRRVLAVAVEKANERLAKQDAGELPERLTPHSLRRTFASLLIALGRDPRVVMGQLGHTDPHLTMRVYAREMAREDGEREALRALVEGVATAVPEADPQAAPALREAA
jgi:integrase